MPRYGLRVKGRHYGVLLLAFTVFMTPSFAAAAEEGTFTCTWIASGKRQSQDFAEGRAVFTYSVKGHVNLKNGLGGIGDIEFIVQYLVLRHAGRYPAVIRYSDNIRQLAALASVGLLDVQTAARLQGAYREFRRPPDIGPRGYQGRPYRGSPFPDCRPRNSRHRAAR